MLGQACVLSAWFGSCGKKMWREHVFIEMFPLYSARAYRLGKETGTC